MPLQEILSKFVATAAMEVLMGLMKTDVWTYRELALFFSRPADPSLFLSGLTRLPARVWWKRHVLLVRPHVYLTSILALSPSKHISWPPGCFHSISLTVGRRARARARAIPVSEWTTDSCCCLQRLLPVSWRISDVYICRKLDSYDCSCVPLAFFIVFTL